MDGRRPIPIGVDDFMKVREGGYCYVDKSELISDIVSQKAEVYLFTRPRRFGKSLNLSMIDRFFNIESRGNPWFDGLKVMDHPDAVSMMNTRPVIHIDMKGLSTSDRGSFISDMLLRISDLYLSFDYLKDSSVQADEIMDRYMRGRAQRLEESELRDSLRLLCRMLHTHHGVAPIVLIDEYDNPINNAHGKAAYDDVLGFLRDFYSAALKGNDDLGFAVVTGVMQIAKESIFSGLNNLEVNNILSTESDERYGFTPSEVQAMCGEYGNPDAFPVAKEWYDGYRFGDAEIYNPWSVLKFVKSGFVAETYWAGTSGNDIIDTLLDHADEGTYRDLKALANGGTVLEGITPTVVMADIGTSRNAVYSVMAMTGYLNAVRREEGYELSIPNREMRSVFASMMERRIHSDAELAFNRLFNGLEEMDAVKVRDGMQRILDRSIPFILLSDEADYQLIIGAAAMSRLGRYTVSLEKESGGGRADIIMVRNSPKHPDIVLELKRTDSSDRGTLQSLADKAVQQIKDREYFRQMIGRVLLWGICFHSKEFELSFEELELRRRVRTRSMGSCSRTCGGRTLRVLVPCTGMDASIQPSV